MRLKSKLLVIFAFSARTPVIAVAAVRLHYLHERLLGRSDTFEYLVVTQWQMGYAIMSSTITGLGPFLRPFNKEYTSSYNKKSSYASQRSDAAIQPQIPESTGSQTHNSWHSEGYLMHTMPSSRSNTTTVSNSTEPGIIGDSSSVHKSAAPTSSANEARLHSPTQQRSNRLTADANFRPVDHISRNDTAIWCGDRTTSFGTKDDVPIRSRDRTSLVINKHTQFKVEVDRASKII